jgi:hypothetical protein
MNTLNPKNTISILHQLDNNDNDDDDEQPAIMSSKNKKVIHDFANLAEKILGILK